MEKGKMFLWEKCTWAVRGMPGGQYKKREKSSTGASDV
jgi:hypothetical protein